MRKPEASGAGAFPDVLADCGAPSTELSRCASQEEEEQITSTDLL